MMELFGIEKNKSYENTEEKKEEGQD